MVRQYVLLAILIAIGAWAFSLTQNIHSIGQWTIGFVVLIGAAATSIVVLYHIRIGDQKAKEAVVVKQAMTKERNDKEKSNGKK